MMKTKTPTVRAARQGLEMSNRSPAFDIANPTLTFIENQRHNPVAWLAARANVAASTARLHVELFGIGGRL